MELLRATNPRLARPVRTSGFGLFRKRSACDGWSYEHMALGAYTTCALLVREMPVATLLDVMSAFFRLARAVAILV